MLFASWQLASQNLSSLLGGSIGLLLALALSQLSLNDWGWRVPFAFGVLIAPVGITIRRQLVETLEKPSRERARGATAILSAVIRSNWRGVLLGLALISGGTITQYFLITMTPYAIRTLHLPASSAMLERSLQDHRLLGALTGGVLADRWGIRPVVIASRIGLMIVLFPVMKFLVANPSATTLVLAITILSLLHAAGVAVVVALMPLIFPPGIRSTGLALTYALGVAIFGGTATYVITWLVGVTGDPLASTYYVMAANVVVLLAALAIRNSDEPAAAWPRRDRSQDKRACGSLASPPFVAGFPPKKPDSTDLDRASQFRQFDSRTSAARAPDCAKARPAACECPAEDGPIAAISLNYRGLIARYTDAIRQSDFKANIAILFVAFMMGPVLGNYPRFPHYLPIPFVMLPFLIVYICLLAVLIPRYPKRGGKHFIVSRNATINDFAKVVEAEDELEQLKLRCSVLSELLWWKTLYIRVSFFVAMASIVASMFLLVYIWYV